MVSSTNLILNVIHPKDCWSLQQTKSHPVSSLVGYLPWVTSNQTESYQSLQLAISSQEGTNPVNKDSVYMERRQLPEKNSMVNQVKTLRDIGNSHNSHHQLLRQSSVRYKSRRPWWSAPPLRTGVDHVFPKFVPRACCAQTLP